jgi:two-component system sensor histidine kinase/response regulator
MDEIAVLYVDDEMNNLISFKASFRLDYSIFVANNASEANEILINNPQIQIVISDQRMPDITGVEFLESVKEKYPNMIRIILTAFSDLAVFEDSMNKGMIFRYLEKPWHPIEMKIAIDNAFQFYTLSNQFRSKNIE